MRLIHHKFQLSITYDKAWRGIGMAKDFLFGNVAASYDYAEDLRDALLDGNLGSHTVVETEKEDHSLKSMFVCFDASIESFKSGCRPFIGSDGCLSRENTWTCFSLRHL